MLAGIFVGGRASRMGGVAKGLLPAPDTGEPVAVRLARLARQCGLEPILVGKAEPYLHALPALGSIEDAAGIAGPLAGLQALTKHAGSATVVALACDLPFISEALLRRLVTTPCEAAVLAPRRPQGFWEPLFARYDAGRVGDAVDSAIAGGVTSFQRLFERLDVAELALSPSEWPQLRDWDTPEDVARKD